jgi:uncharacterized protein involved in exopolysaccharide biosynthesis
MNERANGRVDEFLSFEQALEALSLDQVQLKRLVSQGEIRAYRDGDLLKLRRAEVEKLRGEIARGEVDPLEDSPEQIVFFDEPELDVPAQPAAPAFPGFLTVLRRGWPVIAGVALLVTGAVAVAVHFAPELYTAESRLMVRMGREYVFRPEAGGSETPRAPSLSEMVNSEVEILSSRELAEQTVRAVGVGVLYPELVLELGDAEEARDLAVPKFREALSVRPVLESGVIKVAFEHERPGVAAEAVNALVDRFQEKHLEVFGEDRSDALQREWEQAGVELAKAEQALADYKRGQGVFDLVEQRRQLFERGLVLEQELLASERELAGLARLAPPAEVDLETVELPPHLYPGMSETLLRQRYDLERELRTLDTAVPDLLVREASLRLLDLELEENELLRDYTESNRKVQNVRSGIQRIASFLGEAESKASTYEEAARTERAATAAKLEREIQRLNGEIELLVRYQRQEELLVAREQQEALELGCRDLRVRQAQVAADLQALDGHEQALQELERGVAVASAALDKWRERLDESRLSEHFDREKRTNVRVIERAVPPVVPGGLSKNLQLALGLCAGLLAGVGTAVLAEMFRVRA